MICPNCGTEQPEGFECVRCGIVFARFEEHKARAREGRYGRRSRWVRPVGATGKFGRLAIGFGCIGLAILMYLSGTALKAVGPFGASLFYMGSGIYFVWTVRYRIALWRFVLEGLLLGVASAGIYVGLPDVFSLTKPMYKSSGMVVVKTPSDTFLEAARERIAQVRTFLGTERFEDTEAAVLMVREIERDPTEAAYNALSEVEKGRLYPIYGRLASLRPILSAVGKRVPSELPKGPKAFVPEAVSADVLRILETVEGEVERAKAIQREGQ